LRSGIEFASPDEVDLSFLFHEIWVDGVYSHPGYEIKQGDVVIDIGGNIGVYAALVASQSPDVKVFSYEPFPENAKFFEKNIADSKLNNVKLYQKAVAGAAGTRKLRVADSWVSHSLGDNGSTGHTLEVECIALNDIVTETGSCDLLKIDCEGGEY